MYKTRVIYTKNVLTLQRKSDEANTALHLVKNAVIDFSISGNSLCWQAHARTIILQTL